MTEESQVDVDALLDVDDEEEEDSIFTSTTASAIKAAGLSNLITNGLGATPQQLGASQAFLIARIVDNSGSIDGIPGGPQAICDGANVYKETFAGAKAEDGILMATHLINKDDPIQPFVTVSSVVELVNGDNYEAYGLTPLYRKIYTVMATMLVKMDEEYFNAGIPCSGVILCVTDGYDEDWDWKGPAFNAGQVATLHDEIGRERLILQLMGVGRNADWKKVGTEMGIPDVHIIESTTDPSDIRAKFHMASKSAQSASRSAKSFSQAAAGGFTNLKA
jgi:hypothetical protein